MNRRFFFLAGLPRSGSTLLAAILNQHPEIYSGLLSPVLEFMYYTEQYFLTKSEQYKVFKRPDAVTNVVKNIPLSYYEDIDKKYIMDKNRAWPNNIDRIKKYITSEPKIVCTVRDMPSILASFIHLIEKNKNNGINFVDRWLIDNNFPLTTENRCMYLMQPIGIVNKSMWSFLQAFEKNYQHHLHIVEYADLMKEPERTMAKITDYLGVDNFNFDYDNIINPVEEDDTEYNLEGMHSVRKKISDQKLDPRKILGDDIIKKFSGLEFWRSNQPKIKGFYL